jgi:arabinan endo-1,5-alpha-L-arabinosidase
VTSDPYFGKKIAGGFYVSGEGSYIKHIGDYYYLFVTYGFMLSAENGTDAQKKQGGYQMRVFRSTTPDGPYKDNRNQNAIFTGGATNFGPKDNTHRGINIFGAYSDWGGMTKGEREQGHNSVINGEDGRSYLIYHTRFQDPVIPQGHAVRVHQLFVNKDGWLVAAPFEYTGEEVKSADIATTQQVSTDKIPGTYQLLIHNYKLDHLTKKAAMPVTVELTADKKITGDLTGTWAVTEGTSYMNLVIGGIAYRGVMVEQTLEQKTTKTIAFTGLAYKSSGTDGVTVWAYQTAAATGISDIKADDSPDNGIVYDLNGRRVDNPQRKGIYIRNGKKYIVR